MLSKRTNVLFTENDYQQLTGIAKNTGKTMGELIRHAVRKTYKIKAEQKQDLWKVWEEIKEITKNVDMRGVNYRDLVTEGRKYE